MSTDSGTAVLEIPRGRRPSGHTRRIAVVIAVATVLCCALSFRPIVSHLRSGPLPEMEIVEVDRGDVNLVVIEKGSLESSDLDVVRCRVESFQGLPVGPPPASAESRSRASTPARITRATSAPAPEAKGPAGSAAIKSGLAARSSAERGKSATAIGMASAGAASKPGSSTSRTVSSAAVASARPTTSDDAAASLQPVIRSFERVVVPHVPLRTTLPDSGAVAAVAPPPPTILSILAEGTRVKAGDVVCELDSSAYREALQVEQLRWVQAKAWVEQAKYVLEASEIGLLEYEKGVFPQDLELVRWYVEIRETEVDRAARSLA